jgi:hypothetical protein
VKEVRARRAIKIAAAAISDKGCTSYRQRHPKGGSCDFRS